MTLAFKLFSNNPIYGKRMTTPSIASIPNGARSNNPYPFKKFVFEKILQFKNNRTESTTRAAQMTVDCLKLDLKIRK